VLEKFPLGSLSEIDGGATFSQRDLQHHHRLVAPRWIDAQYFRAEARQKPGGDRSGEHAREVEHPHTFEWLLSRHLPIAW
jgi:hypothetical protein